MSCFFLFLFIFDRKAPPGKMPRDASSVFLSFSASGAKSFYFFRMGKYTSVSHSSGE